VIFRPIQGTIARAAQMATMVGCIHEPALLTAARLGLALSSPNMRYGDLHGHVDLVNDPAQPEFFSKTAGSSPATYLVWAAPSSCSLASSFGGNFLSCVNLG